MANIFSTLGNQITRQVEQNLLTKDPVIGGNLGPAETNPFTTDPIANFSKTNTSFSGTDCILIIQLNNKLIVLGNVQTFSHSTHREKVPVRVLGRSTPKGFTSGQILVAGSIVFVVFNHFPLYDVVKEINYVRNTSDRYTSPLPSQLPPLDLLLLFHNEFGNQALTRLYGLEFVDEGQVHSINDIYSECTMQYVARDIDQMIDYNNLDEFKNMMYERQARGQFIDNYFQGLLEYKNKLEYELSTCNGKIDAIDIELSRRLAAGIVTASASYWLSRAAYRNDFTTRSDLNKEKNNQLKIKEYILKELSEINNSIETYSQRVYGFNAQRDTGISSFNNFSHAPVI